MSHPRSCRDRHCSSSPWGFFQRKVLVSLCLALWWSKNWSELKDFLDMLQRSQISRCALLSSSSPSSSSCFNVCPKVSAAAVYLSLPYLEVLCLPPNDNKPTRKPTRIKYALSPSSSDQLLEQHLSDMAPMTAPYSSVSTPHAGHSGFIGWKLRLMGVGWGTLISCHGKTKSSVNGSCYTVVGMDQLLVYKWRPASHSFSLNIELNGKATVSHQLVVSQPMFGDNAVPFASITCRLSVVMIWLVPLQVGKSRKGFPCRSFCLRGLNPKAAGEHGSTMTLCVCSIASGLLNIQSANRGSTSY